MTRQRKSIGLLREDLVQQRYYVAWLTDALEKAEKGTPEREVAEEELHMAIQECVHLMAMIQAWNADPDHRLKYDPYLDEFRDYRGIQGGVDN